LPKVLLISPETPYGTQTFSRNTVLARRKTAAWKMQFRPLGLFLGLRRARYRPNASRGFVPRAGNDWESTGSSVSWFPSSNFHSSPEAADPRRPWTRGFAVLAAAAGLRSPLARWLLLALLAGPSRVGISNLLRPQDVKISSKRSSHLGWAFS